MRIGFAMGGGGALSLSFVPILELLEKEGIKPDIISGVSMGAIIGALHSLYFDISKVREILDAYADSQPLKDLQSLSIHSDSQERLILLEKAYKFIRSLYLWNVRVVKRFVIDPRPFVGLFKDIFQDKEFKDLKVPFKIVSTSLNPPGPFEWKEGKLLPAILSTSSLPGFFPPYVYNGSILVDGGIACPVPTRVIRDDCDFLIAFVSKGVLKEENFQNMLEVMVYSDLIRDRVLTEQLSSYADFVFRIDFDDATWLDFDSREMIVQRGRETVLHDIEELKRRLRRTRRRKFFGFRH